MKITWRKFNFKKKFLEFWFGPEPTVEEVVISGAHYSLRHMTTNDIKELLAMEKEIYDGQLPWSRSAFLMELRNLTTHRYVVLLAEEKICGFIGARVHGNDCHITNLGVRPNFQHHGLGKFFLNDALAFAKSQGCESLSLEVRVSNYDAQRLYRKFGFVSLNIMRNYYSENGEDAVNMKYEFGENHADFF